MRQLPNLSPTSDEYLTRAEVAQMFSVSPSTVTRWADEGKLVCVKTLGGHRRYQKESIVELVQNLSKEEESVESISVKVPGMYGDHHILAVQKALGQLPGIQGVWASAASREVLVKFDADVIGAAAIRAALDAAGYPSEEEQPVLAVAGQHQKDPTWAQTNVRMTQTYGVGA